MLRRNLGRLVLVGGGAILGAFALSPESIPDDAIVEATGESNPLSKEFGPLSPGFERIEFIRQSVNERIEWALKITFGAHSMSGFGIRHASLDGLDDNLTTCKAPKSTGTKVVPIQRLLEEDDAVYPNRKFDLIAYEGSFQTCGGPQLFVGATEVIGEVTFRIPEQVAPEGTFR